MFSQLAPWFNILLLLFCSSWICGLATGMVHWQDCWVLSWYAVTTIYSIYSEIWRILNGSHLAGKYIIPVHRSPSYHWWAIHIYGPRPTWAGKLMWLSQDWGIPTKNPFKCTGTIYIYISTNSESWCFASFHRFLKKKCPSHPRPNYGCFVLISSCLSSSNLTLWPVTRACLWWGRRSP